MAEQGRHSKRIDSNLQAVIAGTIPALTHNLSVAAQAVRDGASTMVEPGAGLIGRSGEINQNPNTFGFALEHLQALGFNLNAALRSSEARAYQIPVDGLKHGPDIYVDKAGRVSAEFQVKAGSSDYVQKMANSGHYQQPIVANAENGHIDGVSTVIGADGIRSIPVPKAVAQVAADHPYSTAALLEAAANVGEVVGAGVNGATINAAINLVLASTHQLGPVIRGEQKLEWSTLQPILDAAIAGLQSGFIRGAAIKLLQRLMGGNPLAALGFTLAAEAIPCLIQLIQGNITFKQALKDVGPRMLTSGLITVMVLLFPPVGLALLSASVLQAVWAEIAPEWKTAFQIMAKQAAQAAAVGVSAAAEELRRNPLNWLGSSAASAQASSAELAQMDSLLDALLE